MNKVSSGVYKAIHMKNQATKNTQRKKCTLMLAAVPLVLIAGCGGQRSPEIKTALLLLAQAQPPVAVQQLPTPIKTAALPVTNTTKRVYLAGKRVSFVPPAGFTAMTPQEIAVKFPNRGGNPPQHVYANERRSVAVAITFSPARVAPEQLPELKNFMPQFLERAMPDIQWITKDFAAINNVRWIQLEFISRAIDTNIHNDTYFTSFEGKMLGFNFNSTVKQYEAMKAELHKSRDSIMISP